MGLDELVRLNVAHLHVESGRTQGRNFYLFTYLTFSRTDAAEIDPVVVGLTFARADNEEEERVVIDADISGEHTGDRIEAIARREFPRFGRSCFVQHMSWRLNCLATVSGSLKPCLIPREVPEFVMEASRQESQSLPSLSIEEKRQFILAALRRWQNIPFPSCAA